MLKDIPSILSPELVKILMEMGHGDEIVIAGGNSPAASLAQRLVRYDGHTATSILEAVLKLFPLDTYVEKPVVLMALMPCDKDKQAIWEEYRRIIKNSGEKFSDFEYLERFAFYKRAKKAYAVVATSEFKRYAIVILKKGVVDP